MQESACASGIEIHNEHRSTSRLNAAFKIHSTSKCKSVTQFSSSWQCPSRGHKSRRNRISFKSVIHRTCTCSWRIWLFRETKDASAVSPALNWSAFQWVRSTTIKEFRRGRRRSSSRKIFMPTMRELTSKEVIRSGLKTVSINLIMAGCLPTYPPVTMARSIVSRAPLVWSEAMRAVLRSSQSFSSVEQPADLISLPWSHSRFLDQL